MPKRNVQSNPGKTTYVFRKIRGKLRMVPARTTVKNRNVLGSGWPRWSDNLGAKGKKNIEKLTKFLLSKGINPEFNEKGQIKVESRQHQKQLCEASGMIDYNAGLSGDAQPKYEHYEALREREAEERAERQLHEEVSRMASMFQVRMR